MPLNSLNSISTDSPKKNTSLNTTGDVTTFNGCGVTLETIKKLNNIITLGSLIAIWVMYVGYNVFADFVLSPDEAVTNAVLILILFQYSRFYLGTNYFGSLLFIVIGSFLFVTHILLCNLPMCPAGDYSWIPWGHHSPTLSQALADRSCEHSLCSAHTSIHTVFICILWFIIVAIQTVELGYIVIQFIYGDKDKQDRNEIPDLSEAFLPNFDNRLNALAQVAAAHTQTLNAISDKIDEWNDKQ